MGEDRKNIRLRSKVALSLVSIFLFFLLPEAIFRITDREWDAGHVYRRFEIHMDEGRRESVNIPLDMRDPYLFWRAPKDLEFRSVRYDLAKDRSTMRIMCLGDSCTQGFIKEGGRYMEARQTYPSRLQEMLQNYNRKSEKYFEVINAGTGGYSSLQGLRYFKRELLKYNPDIITFYFGINDKAPCVIYSDAEQRIFPQWIINMHNIFMKSRLYQLTVYYQKRNILEKWESEKNFYANHFKMLPPRVSVEEYKSNVETLYKIAKENGIKLIIINFPTDPPNVLIEYNNVLEDLAAQYSIPLVDIVTQAKRYRKNKDKIFIDMCHPTPYFNRIIAKEIYKALVLNKYI